MIACNPFDCCALDGFTPSIAGTTTQGLETSIDAIHDTDIYLLRDVRRGAGMQIRLTHKFAEAIDGVDLSRRSVGDLIDLPEHDADLLIAEGWASPAPLQSRSIVAAHRVRAEASNAPTRRGIRAVEHLRHVREQLGRSQFGPQPHRRAEDRIREERQDSHAIT